MCFIYYEDNPTKIITNNNVLESTLQCIVQILDKIAFVYKEKMPLGINKETINFSTKIDNVSFVDTINPLNMFDGIKYILQFKQEMCASQNTPVYINYQTV